MSRYTQNPDRIAKISEKLSHIQQTTEAEKNAKLE